jgi:PilZ domain-containing protein
MSHEHLVDQSGAGEDRRQFTRVIGPFDGRRIGELETPVRIYDLSEGGCFINSLHEQQPDVTVMLKIELPKEGWITVKARTLYRKPDFGFAMRFLEMTDEAAARLKRTIRRMKLQSQFAH